jgi:hypothetical protein
VLQQVKISGDASLCADLKRCADEDGESLGALIRRVLRGYIRNRQKHQRAILRTATSRNAPAVHNPGSVTRWVHVWIDEADVLALKAFAMEDDASITELIRSVVDGYITARRAHERSRR